MINQNNPLLTYRYQVEISGLFVAGFSEVSGLEQEIELEEFKEGGMDFVHKFPSGIKYPNLVLKRGISADTTLREWYQSVIKAISYGEAIPKASTVYISLLNSQAEEEVRIMLKLAYPIKWVSSNLNATASEVGIETLELVHEGLVFS